MIAGRPLALPVAALTAALALIAVQLLAGGASFAPTRAQDPCHPGPLPPRATALEPVAEQVVLLGVQRAACTLGVTRERLVLALASPQDRLALARRSGRGEPGLVLALRRGLDGAVVRLDHADRLPRASALRDSYVGGLGLSGIAEAAVKQIPDGVVDGLLPTGAVLRRALAKTDIEHILTHLEEPDALQTGLEADIRAAALAEAKARLQQRIPGPIRDLFGLG